MIYMYTIERLSHLNANFWQVNSHCQLLAVVNVWIVELFERSVIDERVCLYGSHYMVEYEQIVS